MAEFLPILLESVFGMIESERGVQAVDPQSFSDPSNPQPMQINQDSIDERTAAIHCLGYLVKNCTELMIPHLDRIVKAIETQSGWYHPNVRIECVATQKVIVEGLAYMTLGKIEDFSYTQGVAAPLSDECQTFIKEVYFKNAAGVFEDEDEDDVIEKQLQNIVELTDEIGAAFIGPRLTAISQLIALNLNPPEDGDEDIDHDEMVIANTTDLIISVSRAIGPDYANYLTDTI